MKIIFLFLTVLSFGLKPVNAQIQVQSLVGHTGIEFNTLIQRDVSANHKLSYFGFTDFTIDYENKKYNSYDIFQVLNYELYNNIGASVGGSFTEGEFMPQAGLYWSFEKNSFQADLIPSLGYTFSSREIDFGLFGFLLYRPAINNKWNFYSQFVFESTFNLDQHAFSYQQLRIGFEYKYHIQFGLGVNLEEYESDFFVNHNIGVFFSKEL